MIPTRISKQNKNIGLRHATFGFLNLSASQKWRAGKFYDKNLEHLGVL
jgi:hypothetical protein